MWMLTKGETQPRRRKVLNLAANRFGSLVTANGVPFKWMIYEPLLCISFPVYFRIVPPLSSAAQILFFTAS
ncbi:hypothetical protein OFC04_25375, partial [Escherichia coli]|nr:hypothetical protein [Escherichia coli]